MGRVKQFDEAEVLQRAMLSFWKRGYEKTTVRNLEHDMGINQFSIYATFKSKEQLYKRSLENYQHQLDREFLGPLRLTDSDLSDVKSFLIKFALSIAQGKIPNSCMMVNSVREIEHFDPVIRKIVVKFFDEMKALFAKAIANSVPMKGRSLDESAEFLVGIAQSISIYSKIKSPSQIKSYINFAMDRISN